MPTISDLNPRCKMDADPLRLRLRSSEDEKSINHDQNLVQNL